MFRRLRSRGNDATPPAERSEARNLLDEANARIEELSRALAERDAALHGTFDHVAIGLAHVDLEGHFLTVNPRLCEITGYAAEELVGRNFAEITHPEDLEADWEHARALLRGETRSYAMEKRYIHKTGRIVWVKISAALVHDASGNHEYFVVSVDDITDRRHLEEERTRLYHLPNHLLCVLDEQSRFLSVNAGFRNVLGYEPEELIGQPIWSFVHPDDVEISAQTEQVGKTTVIVGFENRYRAKDGTYRWLRWTGTVIDGINYGAAIDVTALKTAIEARDQFLSVASHELKTPLTSMKLHSELVRRWLRTGAPLDPERIRQLIDQTDRQVDRLTRLVDDMLDVSRLALGKLALRAEAGELCALVRDVADRLSGVAAEAGCTLEVSCSGTVDGVWDLFRVEQVVTNLLTNAFRYAKRSPVTVRVWSVGEDAFLSVADQGPGIARGDHRRIFERFESASRTRGAGGLGLGLFIVRQIVTLHQGEVRVDSDLGKGTTFTVRLPRHVCDGAPLSRT